MDKHTLAELAKRTQGNRLLDIVNPIVHDNPILEDAPFFPANNTDFHVMAKAIKLAKGGTRGYNEGAPKGFSQTKDYVEPVVRYEFFSDLDEALVDKAPDGMRYRYDEDNLNIEGIRQDWTGNQFLYGSRATKPRDMQGVLTRYNSLSMANVHDAGAAGGASMLVIEWGPRTAFFAYPQRSPSLGIQRNDKGRVRTEPEAGKVLYLYETQMLLEAALCIPDDRAVQRICNIAVSGTTNLISGDIIIDAFAKMPSKGQNAIIYCNTTIWAELNKAAMNKTNAALSFEDVFGRRVTTFWGRPVHPLDELLDTESEVA